MHLQSIIWSIVPRAHTALKFVVTAVVKYLYNLVVVGPVHRRVDVYVVLCQEGNLE